MIILDHMKMENLHLGLISQIAPEIIKVDGEVILAEKRNEASCGNLDVFPNVAKSLNIKVLASHIENEELFIMAKKLGFDFFQGYYFNKPLGILENLSIEEEA